MDGADTTEGWVLADLEPHALQLPARRYELGPPDAERAEVAAAHCTLPTLPAKSPKNPPMSGIHDFALLNRSRRVRINALTLSITAAPWRRQGLLCRGRTRT